MAITSEPLLKPGRAALMVAAMILIVLAACAASVALPHNRYIRYQQFAAGDFARVRWVYERLHFDPTPIDVAVVGSSRLEAAISAPTLEKALSQQLGHPVHVANLAVPMAGRDAHLALAHELFQAHPEVRIILLDLQGPLRRSHPAFRNMADWNDVVGAPVWLNYYWLDNVAYLPFRSWSLFFQSLSPSSFGMDATFNHSYYEHYHGTAFDTTQNFRLDNGTAVNRDGFGDRSKLEAAAKVVEVDRPSMLARVFGGNENIIEKQANMELAKAMRVRCGRLIFVHMPGYKERPGAYDVAANAPLGPIITPPVNLSDPDEFFDSAHLRRKGIDEVSKWLPGALAPYLGPLTASCGTSQSANQG